MLGIHTWYVRFETEVSFLVDDILVFLSHSVRWRTKSKKKSPSGTLITLSAIFTNRHMPSTLCSPSRAPIALQKSLARVPGDANRA